MKINPITTMSPIQLSNVAGPTQAQSGKPKPNQPVPQSAPVTAPSLLSDETKKNLTFATQEIAPHGEHTHKVPPSQQAREAIAANPELAGLPFGQIVSALARGEPLPTVAPASHDEEPAADPIVEEPATPPVVDPPAEGTVPTTEELISDLLTPTPTIDPVIDELLDPSSPTEAA